MTPQAARLAAFLARLDAAPRQPIPAPPAKSAAPAQAPAPVPWHLRPYYPTFTGD